MTVKALEITIDIAVSNVRLITSCHPPRWWARTCGLADQYIGNWHIFRCPASPTQNWRLADGVAFYDPIADSQQKCRSIERQAAIRQCIRAAKPASHHCGVDTGSIPETEASVKSEAACLAIRQHTASVILSMQQMRVATHKLKEFEYER